MIHSTLAADTNVSFVGNGNNLTASTCDIDGDGLQTNYDTKLSVYCDECDQLICLGGNDDGLPISTNSDPNCVVPETGSTDNRASTVIFCTEAGAQYRMLVHGLLINRGDFELHLTDTSYSYQDGICLLSEDGIITLVKNVINDNGGTAGVDDFGLMHNDIQVDSGEESDPISAGIDVVISELDLPRYEFVSITGDDRCPDGLGGTVTIAAGENIECTITNDDIPPQLTLVKVVVNDDGTAVETDWTVSAGGWSPISGAGGATSDGTYTLSETGGPSDYSASAWSCVGSAIQQPGGNLITLALGGSATCTITNDDIPDVPAISTWLAWLLSLSLVSTAVVALRRRRPNA